MTTTLIEGAPEWMTEDEAKGWYAAMEWVQQTRRPEPKPLTRLQHRILNYLRGYIGNHGYAPSFDEIAQAFGLRSLATVHEHLTNLEKKGHIARVRNQARAITVLTEVA